MPTAPLLAITEQVWDVQKKILNITDEFRLNMDFNGNPLTASLRLAHYTTITMPGH